MNQRILLIWDRIGDYHFARYAHFQNRLDNALVFIAELGKNDQLYSWKLDESDQKIVHSLSNKNVQKSDFFNRFMSFRRLVKEKKIDTVIISGYGRIEYLFFIIMSKFSGYKVFLFAESWYSSGSIKDFIKKAFLKTFVNGFFLSGKRAAEHFCNTLDLKSKKMVQGYSAIDNQHFSKPIQNSELEPYAPYLLTVARYSREKNLALLIECFLESELRKKYQLVIIGDGPERSTLENIIGESKNSVILTGWKSYAELPAWYQNASAFILPSSFEPWGLVVNEAMAAGLYVMISEECGCYPDLIKNGYGKGFDPHNKKSILASLNELAALSEVELSKQIKLGRSIIENYDLENWSEKLDTLIR